MQSTAKDPHTMTATMPPWLMPAQLEGHLQGCSGHAVLDATLLKTYVSGGSMQSTSMLLLAVCMQPRSACQPGAPALSMHQCPKCFWQAAAGAEADSDTL